MLGASDRKQLIGRLPARGVVAEIGVQQGAFARAILRRASPSKLHLIDCWEQRSSEASRLDPSNVADDRQQRNYQKTADRMARGIRRGIVELHRGYSQQVLETFPDAYFDWVYIDADHSFEAVTADLEACLPKVKPGGVIAGHDYIDSPHWRAMNFGVVPAVDAFCRRHGWEILCVTREPGYDRGRGNPSYALREAGHSPFRPRRWWRSR